MRDIPSVKVVEGGARTLNLREVVQKEMKDRGLRCRCIRCREVGAGYDPKEKICLFRQDYEASGGQEIFLSFENKKRTKLFGLLRVRLPQLTLVPDTILPVLRDAAIIREVHTYGQMAQINSGSVAVGSPQHRGLGKKLIGEAEKIAGKEFNFKKIAVIASVGTRGYYRKLGYRLSDTYMVKKLRDRSIFRGAEKMDLSLNY
jgi:elongator complex protein 3